MLIIILGLSRVSPYEVSRNKGYKPRRTKAEIPKPKNIKTNARGDYYMPDIERQRGSGALIFTPTLQEQALVDTQKELNAKSEELTAKLKEADDIIAKLKKATGEI